MFKKAIFFVLAVMMMHGVCFAADTWFFTDSDGSEYYWRKHSETRTWTGAHVIKVDTLGKSVSLFYYFEYFYTVPYRIYLGDNLYHNDGLVEQGYIRKESGERINPSAEILFEEILLPLSMAGDPPA